MFRALSLATLLLVSTSAVSGQTPSVLHIKITVTDAQQKVAPVPRHVLLISDNPATAPPRQVVTALDGTASVKLRPGNYTVESDRPVVFNGKAYQWTQTLDIVAGRDAVLELTDRNAEVEVATAAMTSDTDPSFLLPQWQDSIVAVWTATTRGSGFVIDAKGLIATSQRVIGTATSAEVQLTPDLKVRASVLAADPVRDVAVLLIDPKVAAPVRPVSLGCAQAPKAPVVDGQKLFSIGAPLREQKGMTTGTVTSIDPHSIAAEFMLALGSMGGPVFTSGGVVVGIASIVDDKGERRRAASRVVPIEDACEVLSAAEKKMAAAAPPDGTHLPVEPARPSPMDALKTAVQRRGGSLNAYQVTTVDFDVAFITPVLVYGAQQQSDQGGGRERPGPLTDFRNWSDYVADVPPVLLVRATPRMVEGFWTTVARGAARTQGVNVPPIKRVKSGFSRMRVFCGDAEVTPIHPFKLEQRGAEGDVIYEGLYGFDPGALGPHCGPVKLVLYSDKEPEKADTRVVDAAVLQQIWQDFAPHREP